MVNDMAETAVTDNSKNPFSWWKVALPVAIGLGVVAWMLVRESHEENLAAVWGKIDFTAGTLFSILLACLFMVGRDFGLTWRFRALTNRDLPWSKAWKVDMLCEFTSCVTPSAVGGSSLGMVFLNTQGIEFGRATTLMMTTLILDELFFVVSCPLVILFTPANEIFASDGDTFTHGIRLMFWLVYAVLFLWTLILIMGVILKPIWIQRLFGKVFSWRPLRRWQGKAIELTDNMMATSKELRSKPFRFWVEVFMATALSWTSRYLVVNALFLGFVPGSWHDQWIILARQFVIWVVLMVSPTPGGSGLSEWIFSNYYGDIVTSGGLVLILAVFWRLISYYIYLVIGAIIVPGWARKAFSQVKGNAGKTEPKSSGNGDE